MGLSSHPKRGYDEKTQARDIALVMDKLKIEKTALVTHDIGNMVGYALAAQFPTRVRSSVMSSPSQACERGLASSNIPQRSRPFADHLILGGVATRAANNSSKWIIVIIKRLISKFRRILQQLLVRRIL
jgi:pimeloyl-ACP methyl ester carboxylesterase